MGSSSSFTVDGRHCWSVWHRATPYILALFSSCLQICCEFLCLLHLWILCVKSQTDAERETSSYFLLYTHQVIYTRARGINHKDCAPSSYHLRVIILGYRKMYEQNVYLTYQWTLSWSKMDWTSICLARMCFVYVNGHTHCLLNRESDHSCCEGLCRYLHGMVLQLSWMESRKLHMLLMR
jgi:hypothetical protein